MEQPVLLINKFNRLFTDGVSRFQNDRGKLVEEFRDGGSMVHLENRWYYTDSVSVLDEEASVQDHLVILGKGEILLNRSLDEISNRLLFARTDILPAESIYSEQDLSGHFSILPNEDGEENTPDIELLYKAVLQQPEKIQSMFQ